MTYWPRFECAGGIFHVNSHAVGDEAAFRTVEDRRHFDQILAYTAQRLGLRLLMRCQMGNHYHLLLETPHANLGAAMHRINGVYARGFNERHGRRGHLFRERYRCCFIQTDLHLCRAVRYIALNPVKAGICDRPERYRWSSYGETIRLARPWPCNAMHDVLTRIGGVQALAAFVDEGLAALGLDDELFELAA